MAITSSNDNNSRPFLLRWQEMSLVGESKITRKDCYYSALALGENGMIKKEETKKKNTRC